MKFFYSPNTIDETRELIEELVKRNDNSLEMMYLISLVQHLAELETKTETES